MKRSLKCGHYLRRLFGDYTALIERQHYGVWNTQAARERSRRFGQSMQVGELSEVSASG